MANPELNIYQSENAGQTEVRGSLYSLGPSEVRQRRLWSEEFYQEEPGFPTMEHPD